MALLLHPISDMTIEIGTLKSDIERGAVHHTEQTVEEIEMDMVDNHVEMEIDIMTLQMQEDPTLTDE